MGQIDDLEDLVARLQSQVADANKQIDNKLDKLDMAGLDAVSLSKKLAESEERAALLEVELERLVGQDGDLERLKRKLERLACPACSSSFDANSIVKLHVDKRNVTYAGSTLPRSGLSAETLRTALASTNRRLAEAQAENNELKEHAARAAARPSFSQQASLQLVSDEVYPCQEKD